MIQFHKKQSGFTLVELMLAMGGIAFLLLFVVFAVIHTTNLYTRGIALRQINQVGRQINDEISRELRYGGKPKVPAGKNRLCVGTKSYIWNNDGANPSDPNTNKTASGRVIGFVRLDGTTYCDSPAPAIPDTAEEQLGVVATLLSMSISEPVVGTDIYRVQSTYGTALAKPTKQADGSFQCAAVDAQFCAVGDFDVMVYARGEL